MGDIGVLEIGAGYLCLGARQKQGVVFHATHYLSIRNLQNYAMAAVVIPDPCQRLTIGSWQGFHFYMKMERN